MGEHVPATKSEYAALIKRLPAYAGLSKQLITEARLSKKQKIILGAGFGYLASPIDLIPGIIPVLGQLDDILVVLLSIRAVVRDYDQETVDRMLADQGLAREQIDADIALVKETMKAITVKVASTAWRGLSRVGKAAIRKVKSVTD